MKRIVIVLAIVVIAFPMTVLAQKRNTVQGAMTITTTTIVQQEKPKKEKKEKKKKSFNPVKSGWQQSVEVGLNMDFSDYWLWDVGVHYAGGYRINNTFYVGFKTGLDFVVLDDANEEYEYYHTNANYNYQDTFFPAPSVVMLPIYVHFRAYLTKTRLQPFFALSGGAKIGFKRPTEASPVNYCVEPAFGLNLRVSNRSSVYMQLGAPLQIRPYCPYNGYISRRLSPGFSIRIGYTF